MATYSYFRAPRDQATANPEPSPAPIALAHRGFSPDGFENTLAAFRAAAELGISYLETDVRTSRDGVLMAFHDETIDRISGSTVGRISQLSREELNGVLVGGAERIPTFEELLTEWPQMRLNVDVKDAAGSALLAALIEKHSAHDRVLVASFSDLRRLRTLRRLNRTAASSAGSALTAALRLLAPLGVAGFLARMGRFQCVQVPLRFGPIRVVTPGFIRSCHRAGIQVHVWTVNDAPTMNMLLDLGVDGIVSDRSDILIDVLKNRGQWR
ncbi:MULTISPECIES: glycerophosphodiester phosphodiesterase family protein [unclassified Arthrobacter]|uniref:glycerophosphodiester phosphodiesterase family protein n=1 Tax=unclassified Arthrobacter TaxID=235627 RepID=UPI001E43A677|nr:MULTISPECIES: glycerophosphodiester phosphodiesterase family protein [unclassified Arthrobacter]MCC9144207.1 glycerophosphodiester phosphodiesterase [Arthrobacter sp. zg-Y919]MDK1275432.1 glycerophosphodiester phosphodiesterase family protein [Arthrobacter sp. zg.Y919]WIB03186.1 glycerophosphodiester phosphodiesterase family protein [Arthrobacter sp. zg-Y919]